MPRWLRLVLVVVGLGAMVYGAALWTGGWLGVPAYQGITYVMEGEYTREVYPEAGLANEVMRGLSGRALVGLGLIFAAVGAWPRRRRPSPGPAGGA